MDKRFLLCELNDEDYAYAQFRILRYFQPSGNWRAG